MSYVVLARKWRPQTFSDVVGQKHVVATLSAAVRSGRIGHAYLFSGPRGIGKTTVARILAKALNCEEGPTDNPCGKCVSCTEIAKGKSLDVIEIDGASNRRIEDARGIREAVQYAPLAGRKKIYIIDEAHMLTREAFNALLKTLEEPPEHVVFILATTEPGKIPETISSRCQRFDFHRISQAELESRLLEIAAAEDLKVADGTLRLLAARADGSMRDAESLLDQLMSVGKAVITPEDVVSILGIPDMEVFFRITDAVADHDAGAALEALTGALEAGFDPRDLIDGLVEHLGNLLLATATHDPKRVVGCFAEYRNRDSASLGLSPDDLVRLLGIGIESQSAVKWSSQAGLLVELAVVRMARLDRTVSIDEVVRSIAGTGGGRTGGGGDVKSSSASVGAANATNSGGSERRSGSPAQMTGVPAEPAGGSDGEPPSTLRHPEKERSLERGAAYVGGVEMWPDVVAAIRREKPALAAFLNEADAAEFSAGELAVTVQNGSRFHRDQLEDRTNMKLMERMAGSVYGGPVRMKFRFAPTGLGKSGNAGERPRTTCPSDPSVEADDTMLNKVIEIFDGEIVKGT
jgi:DNA polymerase-3 subunit gamma/tau